MKRGSADADRRHQIIITMIYLEGKTDAKDNDCGMTHNRRGMSTKVIGECGWRCKEREHLQVGCWLRPSSVSEFTEIQGRLRCL